MKILHVITTLLTGGAERLLVDLLPRLRDAGHDVELLVFLDSDTPFRDKHEANDIKVSFLGVKRMWSPLNLLRLRRYMRGYDVIHTHNTPCQMAVSAAARLFDTDARLFTTEHNTHNRRRDKVWGRAFDRILYAPYEKIIAVSSDVSEALEKQIGSKEKITVINNGVNLDRFIDRKPSAGGRRILTMVAAFRPQKDQDTAVRALALLPSYYNLCLVGDGERRGEVENLARELGVGDRVVFTGVRTDIAGIIADSHVIIMSSHWEGFGLSAVEGLASGRPVVATDLPGIRQVVGDAGILFRHGDERDLSRAVLELENPALYRQVAELSRKRARKFDINETVKKYIQIYES